MNRRYNIDIVFHVKIRSPLLCFSPFFKLFFTEMFWECGQNLYIYILNHTPFFKFGVILLFPHTQKEPNDENEVLQYLSQTFAHLFCGLR